MQLAEARYRTVLRLALILYVMNGDVALYSWHAASSQPQNSKCLAREVAAFTSYSLMFAMQIWQSIDFLHPHLQLFLLGVCIQDLRAYSGL
jgi:hypothetical protein